MTAPQFLLQAAASRMAARLGSGLVDTAAVMATLAQDAPARIQQEMSLFWEEVEQEAERIERGEATPGKADVGLNNPPAAAGASASAASGASPQEQIDALRARVSRLSQRLEQRHQGPL